MRCRLLRLWLVVFTAAAFGACSAAAEEAAPERDVGPNIMNEGDSVDSLQASALRHFVAIEVATVTAEKPGELRTPPTPDEELAMCEVEGTSCEPLAGTEREIPTIQFFNLVIDGDNGKQYTFPYAGKRVHTWSDGEVQVQDGWFPVGFQGVMLLEPEGKVMDLLRIEDGKVDTDSTAGSVPLRRQIDGMAVDDAVALLRQLITSA